MRLAASFMSSSRVRLPRLHRPTAAGSQRTVGPRRRCKRQREHVFASAPKLTRRLAGSASKLMPTGLLPSSVRCVPGQLRRRWSRVVDRLTREDRVDAALAVLMALVSTIETLAGNFDDGPTWLVVVTGLLITLPLAVRRRFPVGAFVFVLLVIVLESAMLGSTEGVGVFFGLLVSTYTLAAHRPLRPALAGLLFVPVMAFASWRDSGDPFEDLAFIVALVGGFWVAGRVVWSRQQLVEQLEAQAADLERGRAAEARAVAAEERARIARDLHDVVAHSVSVMVVQAEAGEAFVARRRTLWAGAAFDPGNRAGHARRAATSARGPGR